MEYTTGSLLEEEVGKGTQPGTVRVPDMEVGLGVEEGEAKVCRATHRVMSTRKIEHTQTYDPNWLPRSLGWTLAASVATVLVALQRNKAVSQWLHKCLSAAMVKQRVIH